MFAQAQKFKIFEKKLSLGVRSPSARYNVTLPADHKLIEDISMDTLSWHCP